MRVRIITIGAQGDVRPYIALGAGLKDAGHDVRVVTHHGFESLVRQNGLDFAPVSGDPREVEYNRKMRDLHDHGRSAFRWWRTFKEVDAPLMRMRLKDCWDACCDAEIIVASLLPYLFGYAIARKLQIPLVRAFYYPVSPTRDYAPDYVPAGLHFSGSMNLAIYQLQRQVLWQVARSWIAGACRDVLGLTSLPLSEPFGELDREKQLLLYAYSKAVAPPPSDWGSWIQVTGYWFLGPSVEWTPPPALTDFLDDGPPPVSIGFGSMSNRDPARFLSIIERAVELTGQRILLLTEWNDLDVSSLPREIFVTDLVPHDWLFSRVAAAVHHGGAGTTARSLQAGIPTVVVPFFLDQFFWGERMFALGAGPRPIPHKLLTAETLAAAIQSVTNDACMRNRAAAIGSQIRKENGVAQAVEAFQHHMSACA